MVELHAKKVVELAEKSTAEQQRSSMSFLSPVVVKQRIREYIVND